LRMLSLPAVAVAPRAADVSCADGPLVLTPGNHAPSGGVPVGVMLVSFQHTRRKQSETAASLPPFRASYASCVPDRESGGAAHPAPGASYARHREFSCFLCEAYWSWVR